MQQNKLYVGNLPYTVDDAQLRDLFAKYGEIDELALIMDRDTGRPKGFAFVTFPASRPQKRRWRKTGRMSGGASSGST